MSVKWTIEILARAAAEEFAAVWARRLNGQPSIEPTDAARGPGWFLTLVAGGAGTGQVRIWIDRDAAVACTRIGLGIETDPGEPAVVELLRGMAIEIATGLESRPGLAGLTFASPTVAAVDAPGGAPAYRLFKPGGGIATVTAIADVVAATAPAPADGRFEAVLDVDLPLIVRFGRAVMPLRALADLGPGSVIDMGRSPDDPVELLVGQRLIARGEVVIVGGHYGVRITELTGARIAGELEARAS